MLLPLLERHLPRLAIVLSTLKLTFSNYPLAAACLLLLPGIVISFVITWKIIIAPRYSSCRDLPSPNQGPWYRRFFIEPNPGDFEKWTNEIPNNGLIRYFGAFNRETLLVTRPSVVKELLHINSNKLRRIQAVKNIIEQVTGYGILVTDGEDHRLQRKSMLPAFKFKYIKNLYPTFWSHTGSLVRVLEEEIHKGGDSVELIVDDWLPRVTFDIIAKAGFGLDMNAVRDPGNPVIEAMSQVNSTSPEAQKHRMLGFFVPRWALWNWPSKRRWEIDHIVELIHQVALPGIQKRRGLYSSKKLTAAQMEDESIDLENIPDTDTVTTLLRSPYPFSDKELLAQSTTFLLAGQDTVSLATTWALYVLSENPKIQSELRDEIRTNIPSPGGYFADLEPCLLESLPLLYAVCNETLRLFSPIPRITRVNNDHSTIIQERAIPMGMTIVTSPWAIQRSKTIWGGDALEFKPDRYLKKDEVTGKIKFDITGGLVGDAALFGNIAFGAGETGCIGQRFGRAEFAALLAGLVGRLEWRPVGVTKKDVEVQWGIVTRPVDGMNLEVRKVEGW